MRSTILVEGDDDQSVIYHLLRTRDFKLNELVKLLRHPRFGELNIKNAKGADNILADIGPFLKSEAVAVGVVLDRDFDAIGQTHQWPSLRSRVLIAIPAMEDDPHMACLVRRTRSKDAQRDQQTISGCGCTCGVRVCPLVGSIDRARLRHYLKTLTRPPMQSPPRSNTCLSH